MPIEDLHETDRLIISSLVSKLVRDGYLVSVDDGWELIVKSSNDPEKILAALCSTDEDTLVVHYKDGDAPRRAYITLVYGNEPGVVIADHTDVKFLTDIIDPIIDHYSET